MLKVLTFVALAYMAQASDLDLALEMMACAKRAITNGVPELDIPSHSPVYIKHNFTWSGDISVASASMFLYDFIWDGLPQWNVTGTQLSDDSDAYAVFDFNIYWKWMNISGYYDANITELLLTQELNGTLQLEWNHSNWTGSINVTKPYQNLTEEVNDVQINWHVKDLETTVTGLGVLNSVFEAMIGTGISAALNGDLVGNTVGDFIKYRLNTIWWSTGKIWELMQWCQDNPESY